MLTSKDVHSHKTTNTKECNTKSKNIRILIIIVVASLLAVGAQFVYEATIDSNYTGTVGTTNTSITPANDLPWHTSGTPRPARSRIVGIVSAG